MTNLPTINFKEAPGQYWYLYWIGKVTVTNKGFKVKLFFVNSSEPANYYNKLNLRYKEEKIVPIESLTFLTTGVLYDTKTGSYIFPKDYCRNSLIENIRMPKNYRQTSKPLPFLGSTYGLIGDEVDVEGLKYYLFVSSGKTIILTLDTLCTYFFFKSTRYTGRLLYDGIDDLFHLDSRKILIEDKEKVGHAIYNNRKNKLTFKNAQKVSTMLFTEEDKGVKSLKALETRLKSYFITNRNNQNLLNAGTYLNTDLHLLDDVNFQFQGRNFNANGNDYFIVSRIISHQTTKNPFIVDRVEIEPSDPNESTEDRDAMDKEEVTVKEKEQVVIDPNFDIDNGLANPAGNNQEEELHDDYNPSFEPPVTKKKRETQKKAYNVTVAPNEEQLDGSTINTYDTDPESDNVCKDFSKYFKDLKSIDKFEFLCFCVEQLKESHAVDYNFKTLKRAIATRNYYRFEKGSIAIVSLNYEEKYFYLVEFNKRGHTGFIYDFDMKEINPFTLELLVKDCFEDISNLKKGEFVWSKIKKRANQILIDHNIVIGQPLEHQVKDLTTQEAIDKTVDKIYNHRILKLVS